jgi:hypothetical protein
LVALRLKQDVDERCTIPASAGHAIDGSAMLKTFIEECGFAASGQERSRGIPDLIALAHSSATASKSRGTKSTFATNPPERASPSPATNAAIAAGPAKDVLPDW